MNTRPVKAWTLLALIAGAGAVANASDQTSPWSLSILAGDAMGMNGSLRAPIDAPVADLGALNPSMNGQSGTVALHRLHYENLFRPRFDTGLELGYSFSDALQAYGRIGYEGLDGRTRVIGRITGEESEGPASTGEVSARLSDVHNESLEVGSRYTWQTGSDWRPFAGVALGASRVDGMGGTLALQADPVVPEHVRFTRGDTVFSQSAEAGVEYDPGNNFGVRLSVEADHTGVASNARDPKLLALGYNTDNDAQARWAYPVAISAVWHF